MEYFLNSGRFSFVVKVLNRIKLNLSLSQSNDDDDDDQNKLKQNRLKQLEEIIILIHYVSQIVCRVMSLRFWRSPNEKSFTRINHLYNNQIKFI